MSTCSQPSALIVAVVTASLLGASLNAMHGSGVSRVASAAPATQDLFKGTNHYTVPTQYRPGISAYSEQSGPRHLQDMKRLGWHDQMMPLFEHGPHMTDPEAQIASLTNKSRSVHTPPEPRANGCVV